MGQHQIQRRDTFNDSLSILVDNNIEYIAKLQGMKKNLENNILDFSSTYQKLLSDINQEQKLNIDLRSKINNSLSDQKHLTFEVGILRDQNDKI